MPVYQVEKLQFSMLMYVEVVLLGRLITRGNRLLFKRVSTKTQRSVFNWLRWTFDFRSVAGKHNHNFLLAASVSQYDTRSTRYCYLFLLCTLPLCQRKALLVHIYSSRRFFSEGLLAFEISLSIEQRLDFFLF